MANAGNLVSPSLPTGTWFWHVIALSWGSLNYTSQTQSFTLCIPFAPDAPALTSPNTNSFTDQVSVAMSWYHYSMGSTCGVRSDSYFVYMDTNFYPTTRVQQTTSTSITQSVPSIPGSVTYYWRVEASNGELNATSSVFSFTWCITPTISAPTIISPIDGTIFVSPLSITYVWNGSVVQGCSGSSTFDVLRDSWSYQTYSQPSSTFLGGTTMTSYTDSNTLSSGWYTWMVRSNLYSSSPMTSSVVTFRVCIPSNPDQPTWTSPTYGAVLFAQNVTLTWNAPSNFGESCNTPTWYSLSSSSPSLYATNITTTSYLLPLSNGDWYIGLTMHHSYRSSSTATNFISVCYFASPVPILPSPGNTVLNGTVTFSYSMNWGAQCPSPSREFRIYYRSTSNSAWDLISSISDTTVQVQIAILGVGSFEWKIEAFWNNYNATSAPVQFNTNATCNDIAPPAFSLNPMKQAIYTQSATLEWEDNGFGRVCTTGTSAYTIFLDTNPTPTTLLTTVQKTNYSLNLVGFVDGQTYYWSVTATNGIVKTASSNVRSFQYCQLRVPIVAQSFPANGSIVSPFQMLGWSLVSSGNQCGQAGATTFTVYVGTSQTLAKSDVVYTGPQYNATLPSLPNATVLYWRVDVNDTINLSSSQIQTMIVCAASFPTQYIALDQPQSMASLASSVVFSWNVASGVSACGSPIVYYVKHGSTSAMLQSSPALSVTTWNSTLASGVWFWQVVAVLANHPQVRTDSQSSSFTVCTSQPASGITLVKPDANAAILSGAYTFSWTIANVGVDCTCISCTGVVLTISNPNNIATTKNYTISAAQSDSYALSVDGDYSWSITIVQRSGNLVASSSFTVCTTTAPTAPVLVSPANGASGIQAGSLWKWNASQFGSACGTMQHVYFVFFGNPPTYLAQVASPATSFAIPAGSGNFAWFVQASNGLLNSSASQTWSFSTLQGSSQTNWIVSSSSVLTVALILNGFVQNSGTTLVLSGSALSGIAINAESAVLSGNLVLDISELGVYNGMQIMLLNASSITGEWQSVLLQGTSSDCTQTQVSITYTTSEVVASLTVVDLCSSTSRLSLYSLACWN
jgi:hypothetical protein